MTNNGIVSLKSAHSVDQTVAKIEEILRSKGLQLFALVNHSGEAAQVGMTMPSTKLLIFGNAKAGTPLMLASPSVALDLPLRILVAEDAAGNVSVSYNSLAWLQARHGLADDLMKNVAAVEDIARQGAK